MTVPAAVWQLLATAPGEDELRPGLDPLDVSPGFIGFAVVFALVLACIPLFLSLTRKLRGVEHRGRADEVNQAEQREAAAQAEAPGGLGARPTGAQVTEEGDAESQQRPGDLDGPVGHTDGGGIPPAR